MVGFELVDSDEVLGVIRNRGPMQPLEVRGVLKKGDSIMIGASLAELSSRKLLKVTNVKRGGSPYYYVEGQEPKLADLSQYLNEKDKGTFEILKQKRILRDSKQDPLTRVSLREIKDYAKQFKVRVNHEEEIFWRYYLVSEKEAINILREKIAPKKEIKLEPKQEEKPVQEQPKQEVKQEPPKEDKHEETQTNLEQNRYEDFLSDVQDEFLTRLKRFFRDKGILVKEAKLLRKGSDYEFVIEMATAVGKAEYYCKAKGKKKCNDGDLSSAYLQGQMRRLPVVFITTGEVAKKAKEKISTDYKGMILKEI